MGRNLKTIGDRYFITKHIEQSELWETFSAVDRRLNRRVTIKVLSDKIDQHSSLIVNFLHNVKRDGYLLHPNIQQIYDFGQKDGITFVVLKFVEGTTLHRYLQSRWLVPGKPQNLDHVLRLELI